MDRFQLIDRDLEAAAAELLKYDDRLRGLDIEVRFDGGVAHVSGEVEHPGDLACLRELLGRLAGVYAVWDRVRVGAAEPRVVDLGCGETKQHPGNAGVDRRRTPAVSLVADVSRRLPLAAASLEQVFAVHVLEHLLDFLPLLDECHRVLKPGGVLHVMAPDRRHVNAYADPTHVRFLDVQTFKYFCVPRPGMRCWYPLLVSSDGASVFADLVPVRDGRDPADAARLARFFD